ncbi:MAG: hypothetical protein ACXAEN_26175, partial [Candidatus Thorarchaeota archaeon]
ESVSVRQLLERIPPEITNVCITGGEPLIQPTKDLNEFAATLLDYGHTIDLFTNGSQLLHDYFWTTSERVSVIMDYKLPGSGEADSFDKMNLHYMWEKDVLKFVCKDMFDVHTALAFIESEGLDIQPVQVMFGVVWSGDDSGLDPGALVEYITANAPYARLNLQTHKYIWDPEERER